ncbi:hypothetical protein [uncultured Lacinutrix sp.]|uniref:hypothetical protein n=1 Tax=uncultured Lacinutrix sp. TaxID=574032 RepID=UPI00261E431C|nr:hypothetical protein [uncultured Lacinutrix sp.]
MLEILALGYFIKQIRKVAEEKGIEPKKWIIATVVSWFATEILIVVMAFLFLDIDSDSILVVIIPALVTAAIVAYFILNTLKQKEPIKVS